MQGGNNTTSIAIGCGVVTVAILILIGLVLALFDNYGWTGIIVCVALPLAAYSIWRYTKYSSKKGSERLEAKLNAREQVIIQKEQEREEQRTEKKRMQELRNREKELDEREKRLDNNQ